MVLGSLFNSRKSNEDKSGKTEDTSGVAKDWPPIEQPDQSPRISKTNDVVPFHDVKATSFPPPLSIDASVFTEAPPQVPEDTKISKEPSPIGKITKNVREDTHASEKKEIEPCDWKTCPRENHSFEKKQHETKDKISHDKLTEMINVSIKEAIETITKQCRMKQDDAVVKCPGKKPQEKFAKSVCHRRDSSWKAKRERSRSAEECFRNKYSRKANRCQERRKKARTCPKKIDEIVKCHCKKVAPCEDARTKKHSKPSPGKTDNRRMTGNVNIYICSEATENAQPQLSVDKQKKPQPCTESSSETTTEPSNVSSCKLAARIRSKRRKRKEQQSSDFLQSTGDSSDPSNPCSCDSKFSDVAAESESTVCTQDTTESTSTDCRCKDDQVQSDQSITSTFVICDKAEVPCSSIYPSKMSSISDSEEWSSKSCSGAETVLCDQATAGRMSNYGDYYTKSLKRDQDSGGDVCRTRKNDGCKCQGGFRSKKTVCKTREPWSTCSCIAEEDEEDVCVTEKQPPELPVESEDKRESVQEEERSESKIKQLSVDEQIEDKPEGGDGLDSRLSLEASTKLTRPNTLGLKQLLKQGRRSAVDQTIAVPLSGAEDDTKPTAEQAGEKQEPAFLRKFNLRDKDRFLKHLKGFQVSEEAEENRKSGGGEVIRETKTGEKKADEENAEGKKGLPGRLRNSLVKTLRRVSGRENDRTADKASDDTPEKRIEATEKTAEADQSSKAGEKGKKLSLTQKLDINKFFKKKDTPDQKKTASKKKDKQSAQPAAEVKSNTNENKEKEDEEKTDAAKVPEEPDKKSPLSANVASNNPVPKPPNIEEIKRTMPESLPEQIDPQDAVKTSPRNVQEESKDQKDPEDQENKRPDVKEPKVEEFRKTEETQEAKDTTVCPALKKISNTVCTRRPQEKPSIKELNQQASRCVSREPEVHTVCTNQQFPACTNADRSNERIEDSRCNCCCVPAPQSCSRLSNYPKSCLKKERPFRRIESQEKNCSVLYRDDRSWEECCCRRIVLCERCCSPRNECRCRPVPACVTCYKPKTECICNTICPPRNSCNRLKSMVCLYCDSTRESCTCRAPMRKCSCCDLAVDLCCCEETLKSCQGGRPVAAETDCDRTMYVTAWKPREDIRRYFSRNLDDLRHDSINECCCHDKLKPQNSDDLPYQRLSCFSDVMNELQRKISESVCCTQCRKIPCCCNLKVHEERDEKKIKYCVSPKSRRKVVAVCTDKPRSKSPTICKCETQSRPERSKKIVICCICKSSPCRCKKSKPKKPRMKCYYCKNSPCVCIAARERSSKPRPCRCADSPCRTKEKEITVCGKTSAKPKNNEEKMICVR